MKKHGFTLIELLAVIAILALLATLGSKVIRSARLNAKKAQAMIEMKSIETAINAFRNIYGHFPVQQSDLGGTDPEADETFSREVIEILTAVNTADNPRLMVFLDPQSASGADGTFFDPWNQQYRIALDTDGDRQVSIESETVNRKVALVSVGLYELNSSSNTNDLIKSWR